MNQGGTTGYFSSLERLAPRLFYLLKIIQKGDLIQLFESSTIKMQQPINLVYYKNRKLSERVSSFIEFLKAEVTL